MVCAEWFGYPHGFNRFVGHIGERPTAGHQIDRINNDGNYEPGNVRWATTKEQARNRSTNFFIEFDGKNLCCADWAEHLGISRQSLQKRLERWPVERALAETCRESREAPSRSRQEWIAYNLDNFGFINRADIKARFGMSIVQASIDLSLFQKQNPGVLTYNKFTRRYEVASRAHLASGKGGVRCG